jgi:ATP-binding cassette subfamily G (WHITE) protein 2 (SNQ2)
MHNTDAGPSQPRPGGQPSGSSPTTTHEGSPLTGIPPKHERVSTGEDDQDRLGALRRAQSHVDIDYFDPGGVRQLSRSLSRGPKGVPSRSEEEQEREDVAPDEALQVGDQFDFEKAIRTYVRK